MHARTFLEAHDVALASDVVLGFTLDFHHSQDSRLGVFPCLQELHHRTTVLDLREVFLLELVSLQVVRKRCRELLRGSDRAREGGPYQERLHGSLQSRKGVQGRCFPAPNPWKRHYSQR